MNLNGQEYESYYLTAEEKAVVDAMRAGANVDITLRIGESLNQIDEVDKFFATFNGLEVDAAFVHDQTDFQLPYIGFSKFFRNSKVTARVSVHMERVIG